MNVELVSLLVPDYDEAIAFFTKVLGFELVEDSPATTTSGLEKRWVVVRPPGALTGVLLARPEGGQQLPRVGDQVGDRVGFFLRADDFDGRVDLMRAAGVTFLSSPRQEPYGKVAVFLDIAGNRWDLLG